MTQSSISSSSMGGRKPRLWFLPVPKIPFVVDAVVAHVRVLELSPECVIVVTVVYESADLTGAFPTPDIDIYFVVICAWSRKILC